MTRPETTARRPEDPMPSAGGSSPHATPVRDGHARQCTAHTRSGARCRAFAVEGMAVCRMHGGSSPQARRAAERRRAESQATVLLEQVWDPSAAPVTDPVMALQRMAGRLEHAIGVLGARVNTTSLDGPDAVAWSRVIREQRQLLVDMERLGIASRAVEVQQQQAELMLGWINVGAEAGRALAAGSTPEQVVSAVLGGFLDALRRSRTGAVAAAGVVRGELE